jgi:hypothetical protein
MALMVVIFLDWKIFAEVSEGNYCFCIQATGGKIVKYFHTSTLTE